MQFLGRKPSFIWLCALHPEPDVSVCCSRSATRIFDICPQGYLFATSSPTYKYFRTPANIRKLHVYKDSSLYVLEDGMLMAKITPFDNRVLYVNTASPSYLRSIALATAVQLDAVLAVVAVRR
jgi:hypothetical protein